MSKVARQPGSYLSSKVRYCTVCWMRGSVAFSTVQVGAQQTCDAGSAALASSTVLPTSITYILDTVRAVR